MIRVAHITPESFQEYPDEISSLVWTSGCNLNCSFCHNKQLLIPTRQPIKDPLAAIETNKAITAVVALGGEPTTDPGLHNFSHFIKDLGLKFKLFTNGIIHPVISQLAKSGTLDAINIDIKAVSNVSSITNTPITDTIYLLSIHKSIDSIRQAKTNIVTGKQIGRAHV